MSLRLIAGIALFAGAWWLSGWLGRQWQARRLRRALDRLAREAQAAGAAMAGAEAALRRTAADISTAARLAYAMRPFGRVLKCAGGEVVLEVEGDVDDQTLAAELRRRFGPKLVRVEVAHRPDGRWHAILMRPSAPVGDAAFDAAARRAIEDARNGGT